MDYRVLACFPSEKNNHDNIIINQIKGLGVDCYNIPLKRQGLNPFKDIYTLLFLIKLIKKNKPDIVLSYTIKPIIYGSLAAYISGINKIFSMVTGIGYAFYGDTLKQKLIGKLVKKIYKSALHYNAKVFFQNPDDLDYFISNKLINSKSKTLIINGSGVDLNYYSFSKPPINRITFLLIARFLKEKGIFEFIDAAKILKNQYPKTRYQIIGWRDDGPSGINMSTINNWEKEPFVELLGYKEDVRKYLQKSSVYVLPSYREGTPRTVLEAMSTGRPIVTADSPGCRETVINNKNGFLVPIRNSKVLAKKMEKFILEPSLINKMGKESRKIAELKYDVNKVNNQIINGMGIY
tara:strand:- start:2041 stop:3090 length:1050 start_codon:yes stop_codon:yes gene_type:complete